jgi:hypothetical protein
MYSKTISPAVTATFVRAASVTRNAALVVHTSLWRSAAALVDHPSDAPPQ